MTWITSFGPILWATPADRLEAIAAYFAARVRQRRTLAAQLAQVRTLLSLDDTLLRDIGVTRGDLRLEMRRLRRM